MLIGTFKVEKISIHAPHTGRDIDVLGNIIRSMDFNPRAPYGARPAGFEPVVYVLCNFNPRAPYGARLTSLKLDAGAGIISIHAPHTGRDLSGAATSLSSVAFQSTRPIRGATGILL